MEAFTLLENKISVLLGLVKKLKTENSSLKEECVQLKAECAQLAEVKANVDAHNGALQKEVEQLVAQLEKVEGTLLAHDESVSKLNKEKTETKSLIDELIKDIDSLVASENQQ